MVDINLLPWRVYLREYIKTQIIKYTAIVLFVVFSLLLIVDGRLYYKIHHEKKLALFLQQKQKNNLLNNMTYHSSEALQSLSSQLQHNHQQIIHFLKEVVLVTPEDIFWKNILSENGDIVLLGETQSLSMLLYFVKTFDGVNSVFHADIIKIKSLPNSDSLQFSLRFSHALTSLQDK